MSNLNKHDYLHVEGLHKAYGALDVIKGVSFSIDEHKVLSLLGASGSGKSTILRCINLLEIPNRGDIYIDGERLPLSNPTKGPRTITGQKKMCQIRSRLCMVFQQFNLWAHMTVLENVVEGLTFFATDSSTNNGCCLIKSEG